MKLALSASGRAYIRTTIASLLVFAIGISQAPDLSHTYLYGTAAVIAILAAGLRFLQAYLSWATLTRWLGQPYGDWADSFVQGFLGSLVVTLTGWTGAPDIATAKAFVVAAILGAVNAGVRALQGLLDSDESPNLGKGLPAPKNP